MSSTTADTYPESVGSCCPPTRPASPPPHPAPAAALRAAPVRRQLDFAEANAGAGAGGDLDDYDDNIISAVDDIERGYNEAKRRAQECICKRGDCAVQWNNKRARWMYVCPAQPKCKHVKMCEEVDQNPQSWPAVRSDPKPSNPCVFNVPRTPVDDARTQINNVKPPGAGATTPVNVSPQADVARAPFNYTSKGIGATTPIHVSPQGAGTATPVHVSPQAAVVATPFNYTFKGVGTTTPVLVSPQGAGAMTPVHASPQGGGAPTPVNVIPQAAAVTPVLVSPQGAGATTPVHASPQGGGAMTPVNVIPQAGAVTPVHVSPQGGGATTPVNVIPQAGAVTPVHVSPQGASTKGAVKVSPRWHRSNDGQPICQCTAGKCKISKVGNEDCYVCPIPKGQGACSFKMPVTDAIKGPPQIGDCNIMEAHGNTAVGVGDNDVNGNPAQPSDDEWPIPFDVINNEIVLTGQAAPHAVVHQKSPGTPRQQIATVKTPTTSPMTPFGSRSPMTGRPCHGCGEEGHWIRNCPNRSSRKCFRCGMVGHLQADCPQPRGD